MSMYSNLCNSSSVLHEGWLWHKSNNVSKWKMSWVVLLHDHLFFLNSSKKEQEAPTHMLFIDKDIKFEKKDGSERNTFKFELHLNKEVYKFKTSKFSEREQWRAYIEGVITGEVSASIDLLPEHLQQIRDALERLKHVDKDKEKDHISMRPSQIPPILDSIDSASIYSDTDSGLNIDLSYLEPSNILTPNLRQQTPRFFNNSHGAEEPSWFFHNCSRDLAKEILTSGVRYGNTLMRAATTNTGNFVISKKMDAGGDIFSHYEVTQELSGGYKLKVENPHQPMSSLSEVMDFFVETSGSLSTIPMKTNNMLLLGVTPEPEYNHYNPFILPSSRADVRRNLDGPSLAHRRGHQLSWSNVKNTTGTSQSLMNLSSQTKRSSHTYMNVFSQNDQAPGWRKSRSPSVPDTEMGSTQLKMLLDKRKSSLDQAVIEGPQSSVPPTSQLRLAQNQQSARPAPPLPPPPQEAPSLPPQNIPPAPPAPPLSAPPPLPKNFKNHQRISNPSPLTQSPGEENRPQPPGNHPPPLKKTSSKTSLTAAQFSSLDNDPTTQSASQKKDLDQERLDNSPLKSSGGAQSVKDMIKQMAIADKSATTGRTVGGASQEFIKKLELTFGGKSVPSSKPTKTTSPRPDLISVLSGSGNDNNPYMNM